MEEKLVTVEELVERSKKAQSAFEHATQEQADAAAKAVCKIIYDNAEMLGKMAAEETRMGNEHDKIQKCYAKSALIWQDIKDKKSVGIIHEDKEHGVYDLAKPMGVVASVVPSTNPVVTPMSNAAFAFKCRNSVIFSPHPRAVKCTAKVVGMIREELKKLNLPEDLCLGLAKVSIEDSQKLMSLADIVVATGGPGMVKSAYSCGKPALGVGAGNVQVIVDEDVDLEDAAKKIIAGRTFDNGLICLGEQTAFVPASKFDEFVEIMKKNGAYYVEGEELPLLREGVFPNGGPLNRDIVGQKATLVAEKCGFKVPEDTKLLLAKPEGIGAADDLCREKITTVLSVYPYETFEEGVNLMYENLKFEGMGHSIAVHTNKHEHALMAAEKCGVSRCIVNQPAGTTGGGSPTNGFVPTTTLGCGTWGGNSFSGNLSYHHLMNTTRMGYPLEESYLPNPEDAWK